MVFKKYTKLISHRIKNRSNNRAFVDFASRTGLVYFGTVNQHHDEHELIRGLTMSSSIRDDSYSVGTIHDYNISIVDRSDYSKESNSSSIVNNWVILRIELHTKAPIPHFFIGTKNKNLKPYHSLFISFPNMKEVSLGVFEEYSTDFTSRYTIFARPAKFADVQNVINTETANVIAAHFWPLCVEQHNNVIYLYSTNEIVNGALLDKILKNGLWLADQIDKRVESDG